MGTDWTQGPIISPESSHSSTISSNVAIEPVRQWERFAALAKLLNQIPKSNAETFTSHPHAYFFTSGMEILDLQEDDDPVHAV